MNELFESPPAIRILSSSIIRSMRPVERSSRDNLKDHRSKSPCIAHLRLQPASARLINRDRFSREARNSETASLSRASRTLDFPSHSLRLHSLRAGISRRVKSRLAAAANDSRAALSRFPANIPIR